jgi:hypothetical protein
MEFGARSTPSSDCDDELLSLPARSNYTSISDARKANSHGGLVEQEGSYSFLVEL